MFGKIGLSLLRHVNQIILDMIVGIKKSNAYGVNETAYDAILLDDGRSIICGGIHRSYTYGASNIAGYERFGMAMYKKDGTLDTTFGDFGITYTSSDCSTFTKNSTRENNGYVTTDPNISTRLTTSTLYTLNISRANSVCIQKIPSQDHKILLGGYASIPYVKKTTNDINARASMEVFAIVRYNMDGTIDDTFGTEGNGRVVIDIATAGTDSNYYTGDGNLLLAVRENKINKIKCLSDGSIIAVGYCNTQNFPDYTASTGYDSVIAKFDTNGGFVTKHIPRLPGACYLSDLHVDNYNNIIVCGYCYGIGAGYGVTSGKSETGFYLSKYDSNLNNDTSFGDRSEINDTLSDEVHFTKTAALYNTDQTYNNQLTSIATSISVLSNGTIVLSGYSPLARNNSGSNFAIASFDSHGINSSSNGTFSKLTIDMLGSGVNSGEIWDSCVQTINGEEKIIVCGRSNDPTNKNNTTYAIARYQINSSSLIEIDNTFGTNGFVYIAGEIPNLNTPKAISCKILPTNDIIIYGHSYGAISRTDFTLLRISQDGNQQY